MYARIGTFDVPPARLDEVVELVRTDAVPAFRGCAGFLGYRAYVDRERGRLIGISLWTTREALDASSDRARAAIARGAALGAQLVGEPQILAQAFDEPGA
jgi:quinol monooxygenase YgiN